jgi:hypothetical protein
MGIKLPQNNPMLVEMSAYKPLVSSGIVGKIKINPKNILILKDVDRFFNTNVVSIETDEEKHCIARKIENYRVKNTLFDGEALIDNSIFPEWADGYILLRQHMNKMAAFSSNIQKFFKDYFGDSYHSATVKDMFGVEHFVKDIELITTDNAMKWIKFGKSYEYWCEKVYENNCMFGIVKTAHGSKLGKVQKMSYQMVNSLDNSIMPNVVKSSVDYVNLLKTDVKTFLEYLDKNKNFSNDFEVLIALCKHNKDFERSSYFRSRRKKIIESYVLNLKCGEIIQDAENLTVVGSPYALLLYAATGEESSVDGDDTFHTESDSIQCHTNRFDNGQHLAFFRSPFNSKNNLTHLHNVYDERFDKYFNFGEHVIAINMIGTDVQDRNNGMDQDSDFGFTTSQPDIVAHARFCYLHYPTIVNNIPKDTNVYQNTMSDYANIDDNLSESQLAIGESSNLAQIAQTYDYNFPDLGYSDYVCILSVLAQVAIDSAKRQFEINLSNEIRRIKLDMNIAEHRYPKFWKSIKRNFSKRNINPDLVCPMNYLQNLDFPRTRARTSTMSMNNFFIKHPLDINRTTCKRVEGLISDFSLNLYNYNTDRDSGDYFLLRSDFDDLVKTIQTLNISKNYLGLMSWLIDRALMITPAVVKNKQRLKTNLTYNRSVLLKTLYTVNPHTFLKCFKENT